MSQSLLVFDIERFSIHDGPGIRTTVFLKGCSLRCPWCANPESWKMKPELMRIGSKCVSCGLCASCCPSRSIRIGGGSFSIDRSVCEACGLCVSACPNVALRISGKSMPVSEIMGILLRDSDYYENSGGGVTLSGGEPLMQIDGAVSLLSECKRIGLHTAVETTGNVPLSSFERALPLTDLFLFDIKHSNASILEHVTGGNLNLILRSLHAAAESAADTIIRIPVIPGFNDNANAIDGIYDIAIQQHISQIHLLPYHTLGISKFEQLGMEYPYSHELNMLHPERLIPFCEIGERKGLSVVPLS